MWVVGRRFFTRPGSDIDAMLLGIRTKESAVVVNDVLPSELLHHRWSRIWSICLWTAVSW